MDTLRQQINTLEKRTDKHSREIDEINDKLSNIQLNLGIQEQQMKLLESIQVDVKETKNTVKDLEKGLTKFENRLNLKDKDDAKRDVEINSLSKQVKNLQETRAQDHLEKPLQVFFKIVGVIGAAVLAYLLGKFGL